MTDEPYLSYAELVRLSGLSERTLRNAISDPVHPLPVHCYGRRRLFLKSEFDAWLRSPSSTPVRQADDDDDRLTKARERASARVRELIRR